MNEEQSDERKKSFKTGSQNVKDLYAIVDNGYTSDHDIDTRTLVTAMNRKRKKSGGFSQCVIAFCRLCIFWKPNCNKH